MASLSLCPQFETNLMSNREVVELFLQLKSTKAHGKNYIKVKPPLARHLLRKRLLLSNFRSKSRMGLFTYYKNFVTTTVNLICVLI